MAGKTAIITGANAGIGYTVAERLLQQYPGIRVCLVCRNEARAENARSRLVQAVPGADVDVIIMDVSSTNSVYTASNTILEKYKHVDYLFLNAGVMPLSSFDWVNFFKTLFSSSCFHMFRTGDGILIQKDGETVDGNKEIFSTNLLGHFIMVKQLLPVLEGPEHPTQIIWTGSNNAKRDAFSLDDIQHKRGYEPYSSSKQASNLIHYAINEKYNKQGIFSHTTCPGIVLTGLTYGILPQWLWTLIFPIMMLLRLVLPNMTRTTYNGSEALMWLTEQNPASLDPMSRFNSRISFLGNRYTEPTKLDITSNDAGRLYDMLDDMEKDAQIKYRGS